MNILVTGGAGYIGSHAVYQLLKAGHNVTVLDNLVNGSRERIPDEVPFYQVDLADTSKVKEILSLHAIDTVMHFAALISVNESNQQPLQYFNNNVGGTISLLEAMREAGVHRIIFSSTAAIYADGKWACYRQWDERALVMPKNAYAKSKQMTEDMLLAISAADPKFRCIIFRCFNVAGYSQEVPSIKPVKHPTHLIPSIFEVVSGNREVLQIFGDHDTADGSSVRDYIHVDDVVSAHLKGLDILDEKRADVYNLGTGIGHSVLEVVAAAKNITGKEIPVEVVLGQHKDTSCLIADARKARRELSWEPMCTKIDDMLASAWQVYSNR